ncbi:hypothetical protein GE300_01130 [Rhodobacteraceae bacterium 2CG4]|uniref:Uncharacterized protein n=1 Tax=Halovulum marinum TaxID=2662447 RepID=A0A6L5YVD2_9RHOB|nr:hypothetical protein [Halovulum marinum]MSU88217.1 hypothetical protein [Halovulum marinum]
MNPAQLPVSAAIVATLPFTALPVDADNGAFVPEAPENTPLAADADVVEQYFAREHHPAQRQCRPPTRTCSASQAG